MKEPKHKVSTTFYLAGDLVRKPTKNGGLVVLDRTYYEEDGMTDLANKPTKFWVFTRSFQLSVSLKGNPTINLKRDVVEIAGINEEDMSSKLEKFVNDCYDRVPESAEREWIPNDFLEVKRAIKSGALKV